MRARGVKYGPRALVPPQQHSRVGNVELARFSAVQLSGAASGGQLPTFCVCFWHCQLPVELPSGASSKTSIARTTVYMGVVGKQSSPDRVQSTRPLPA